MTRRTSTLLLFSAVAFSTALAACAGDDSVPSRPRTANPLAPDNQTQDNAEHRILEKPERQYPTGGAEFPGQSMAAPMDHRVLTLQASPGGTIGNPPATTGSSPPSIPATAPEITITTMPGAAGAPEPGPTVSSSVSVAAQAPNQSPLRDLGFSGPPGWQAWRHTTGPIDTYTHTDFPGPLALLPLNPGTTPMPGGSTTPDGEWTMQNSWGQGLVLENYPHRPWPEATAKYQSGATYVNPTYFFNIQEQLDVQQADGSYRGDEKSMLYEIPWFMVNTAALPVLMVLEPPLAKRTFQRASDDPNYRGHLPADGPIVPAPSPGALHWEYTFLNPDGTVKEPDSESPQDVPPAPLTNPPSVPPATMPGG